jgi:hypothetical protein
MGDISENLLSELHWKIIWLMYSWVKHNQENIMLSPFYHLLFNAIHLLWLYLL